jgi:hypothetical protein
VTTETSLEARIVESFDRLRPDSPSLRVLRRRLIGELFGDADDVAATLDPEFTVVMHSGGSVVTLPGSAIADGVRGQAAAGVLMWTELDDVVIDGDVIAASGAMMNLHLTERTLHCTPIGLFLRFRADLMISEIAFMGASTATDVSADRMPTVEALRARLVS